MYYSKPVNILDNFYDVYSGAGMDWYKFDIWYQYMAGASMFFHEEGFDEFWTPGGRSAGVHDVQLSPKGKLVDRFLRITKDFDRGTPYTPVAFLADYAHGWTAAPFRPAYYSRLTNEVRPDLTSIDDHGVGVDDAPAFGFRVGVDHVEDIAEYRGDKGLAQRGKGLFTIGNQWIERGEEIFLHHASVVVNTGQVWENQHLQQPANISHHYRVNALLYKVDLYQV
jgi:hypothetical protein